MRKIAEADWSQPGGNRFVGDVSKAIMGYDDIPLEIRERLAKRAFKPLVDNVPQYDEIATIDKWGIRGDAYGYTNLRLMHFGKSIRAERVSMAGWPATQVERALIYHDTGHTVIVPLVCGNVARVDRVPLNFLGPVPSQPEFKAATLPVVKTVPEPSSLAIVAVSLLALVLHRRRALSKR